MAHNLHLVVVKADSPEDACDSVETYIMDYGNENNWITICGCVSEFNEVYDTEDGRFRPDKKDTIAKLNKLVKGWLKPNLYCQAALTKLAKAKGKINLSRWSSNQLWSLQQLAKHEYKIKFLKNKKVNILDSDFNLYPYEYCENGVTQTNEEGGDTTYVVYVDMHD